MHINNPAPQQCSGIYQIKCYFLCNDHLSIQSSEHPSFKNIIIRSVINKKYYLHSILHPAADQASVEILLSNENGISAHCKM